MLAAALLHIYGLPFMYCIAQLCMGKYWRISLSARIGGEIFGDFGFKSKDTKLVRKYWWVKYWQMAVAYIHVLYIYSNY